MNPDLSNLHKPDSVYISVVSPVYGCCSCLIDLCQRLTQTLQHISPQFEIILVDDASPDDAWNTILHIAESNPSVKGLKLSRNFGQHHAITAGLDIASGRWVVVMDCDLQDKPEEILRLHEKAQQGYDVVVGLRRERQDSVLRRFASTGFYKLYSFMTGTTIDPRLSNFGIYADRVIRAVCQMREHHRSFGLFVLWAGFSRAEIEVTHQQRASGTSGYTLWRMTRLAFDSIVAYSNRLLHLTVAFGLLMAATSLVMACGMIIRFFTLGLPVTGWTSLIVSIYFTAGLIIGSVGITGLYIGKIFHEVKNRPLYLVRHTTPNMDCTHV